MSEVTRYEYDGGHGGSQEMLPFSGGAWVRAADYDALAAELATERLRADAAVGDANAAERRVAELEELMASQAKAIREERETYAMSMKAQQPSGLVLPARMTTIPEGKTISYAAGYEDALDAVASLNRNTVPLELLARAAQYIESQTYFKFGEPVTFIDTASRDISVELRAILAGDKP